MYRIQRLSNNVTLATVEMPHMSSVSFGIWVAVGGRFEPLELNGVSHFIEHLLFKGTRKRTAREISQGIEGIGGYLNAFTTEEGTCFFCRAGQEHLEELVDVMLDMFLNSTFAPVEIEKEREVIKEEVAMYVDQPQLYVQEVLSETLWPNHPLGRSLTGSEKTLDRIARPHILDFFRANYVSDATLIVCSGRVRHESVARMLKPFLPKFAQGRKPRFQPVNNGTHRPDWKLITRKTEQTQVALGVRTCSRHDERRYALRVLNAILGENMSSRLFQIVREEKALAYSICSSLTFFEDAGFLNVSAGLDTEKLGLAMKLIGRELRRLREVPPTAGELRRARDYLVGQMDLALENTENQMMWVGEHLLGYGKLIAPSEVRQGLMEVTPAEVRAAARDFLSPDRSCLALVSPLKSDRKMGALLRW